MGITLASLRAQVSREMGDYQAGTTTADGSVGGTTLIDLNLKEFAEGYFNNWYVLITSGSYVAEKRRIDSFAQGTGTITVFVAFSGKILASVTYELHRYDPDDKKQAINDSRLELYPVLGKWLDDQTLITGNALPNSNFEDWSASTKPDFWEVLNVTSAKETSIVRYGKTSAKVTRAGTDGHLYISGAERRALLDLGGHRVKFQAWVRASVANQARLQIADDDGTTSGDYHSGGGDWELLEMERQIKEDTKIISFRLRVENTNGNVYFDNARTRGGSIFAYVMPQDFADKPLRVYIQGTGDTLGETEQWIRLYHYTCDKDAAGYLILRPGYLTPGRKLRLVGKGYLSSVASNSDEMELDSQQSQALAAHAASLTWERSGAGAAAEDRSRFIAEADKLRRKAQELLPKVRQPGATLVFEG